MVPNWYVITGGPSSGKTTIINELSKLGCFTVPEAARIIIDEEMKNGKTLEEIRRDEMDFQVRVLEMKIEIESKTPRDKTVFLDRAIPDSIAFYDFLGVDSQELKDVCKEKIYKKIFFLEMLPYEKDYARTEGEDAAKKMSELLFRTYSDLGYEVVRIPVMPVEERVEFILSNIEIR